MQQGGISKGTRTAGLIRWWKGREGSVEKVEVEAMKMEFKSILSRYSSLLYLLYRRKCSTECW